jgi:hypothetical protein
MTEKVTHKIDLTKIKNYDRLKKTVQTKVKKEVADLVKESIFAHLGEGRTPVKGAPYKRSLSPAYKERKGEHSSVDFANLELHGDMLDALKTKNYSDGVEVGIFAGGVVRKKAYNHNVGDTLPTRRFIPLEDEKFKVDPEIKKIVKEFYSDKDNRKKTLFERAAELEAARRARNGES